MTLYGVRIVTGASRQVRHPGGFRIPKRPSGFRFRVSNPLKSKRGCRNKNKQDSKTVCLFCAELGSKIYKTGCRIHRTWQRVSFLGCRIGSGRTWRGTPVTSAELARQQHSPFREGVNLMYLCTGGKPLNDRLVIFVSKESQLRVITI